MQSYAIALNAELIQVKGVAGRNGERYNATTACLRRYKALGVIK